MTITLPAAPNRVLAATDGSDVSQRALRGARLLADALAVELRVVHARTGPEHIHDALALQAEEQAHVLGAAFDLIASGEHLLWDVTKPLVGYVANWPGAILCLSSHGRSGLAHSVLGSVATGVIAAVDVPVLVFGPNAAAPTRFARVLGCTDGSHFAEGAVAAGASLSQALGVPLWVVDVVDPGTADTPVVAALAARLGEVGVEAQWDTLHDRHADVGIARYAAEVEGTITALASHGRSGWRELLMGTVAAGVVRRASSPVLLVCPAATG